LQLFSLAQDVNEVCLGEDLLHCIVSSSHRAACTAQLVDHETDGRRGGRLRGVGQTGGVTGQVIWRGYGGGETTEQTIKVVELSVLSIGSEVIPDRLMWRVGWTVQTDGGTTLSSSIVTLWSKQSLQLSLKLRCVEVTHQSL